MISAHAKQLREKLLEKPRYHYLFLFVLAMLLSWLALHNIETHYVGAWSDDVSIAYAHLAKYPDRFAQDIFSVFSIGATSGTLLNWSAAFLWKYLNVSPYLSYNVFAYLQSIMLGVSIYLLVWWQTRWFGLSLASLLFMYAVRPYAWNLANYNDLYPFLYAGQIATAFGILTFAFMLRGLHRASWLALFVTGLLHPSMGLYTAAILGLYLLWRAYEEKDSPGEFFQFVWPIIMVSAAMLLPSLSATIRFSGSIPKDAILDSFLKNTHFNPFSGYLGHTRHFRILLLDLLKLLTLVLLSSRFWTRLSGSFRRLWWAALVATLVLVVSHYLGAQFEILPLMQLAGGRAASYLAILSTPLLLLYYFSHLSTGDWLSGLAVFAVLPGIAITGSIPILVLPLFLLIDVSQGQVIGWQFGLPLFLRRLARGFAICLLTLQFLAWQIPLNGAWLQNYLMPNQVPDSVFAQWLILIVAILVGGWLILTSRSSPAPKKHRNRIFPFALIALLALIAWQRLYHSSQLFVTPSLASLAELQTWVRSHTSESARFVGQDRSWRTNTERSYLLFYARPWYAYTFDQRLYTFEQGIWDWFGGKTDEYSQAQLFYSLTTQDFIGLQIERGVDYLVWPKDLNEANASLDFALAYESEMHLLYDLRQPISEHYKDMDARVAQAWQESPQHAGYVLDLREGACLNSARPYLVFGIVPSLRRNGALIDAYLQGENLCALLLNGLAADPGFLQNLGVEYIYIDQEGWGQSAYEVINALSNKDIFEEVIALREDGEFRMLFRLIDFDPTY